MSSVTTINHNHSISEAGSLVFKDFHFLAKFFFRDFSIVKNIRNFFTYPRELKYKLDFWFCRLIYISSAYAVFKPIRREIPIPQAKIKILYDKIARLRETSRAIISVR